MQSAGKHILLGITGGIAACKSPDLVRRLMDTGAQVQVVMTRGAAVRYAVDVPNTVRPQCAHRFMGHAG